MRFGIKDTAQGFFFAKDSNEVIMVFGYEERKQKELSKLIKNKNKRKKKRIRKKINKKIDKLLGR